MLLMQNAPKPSGNSAHLGFMVFSPLVGLAPQRSGGHSCADEDRRIRPRSAADISFWLELPMATMQHPNQRTGMGDIEPGAKPTAVVPAPPVWASGRG
jgi:hypothetical protein